MQVVRVQTAVPDRISDPVINLTDVWSHTDFYWGAPHPIRNEHSMIPSRPFRRNGAFVALCLFLAACSSTKDAVTGPRDRPDIAFSAPSINVAAAANGGTVVASSSHPSGVFPTSGAINGDRLGLNWGNGGGWNDGTADQWPDWMEVTFAGTQTIGEVDVFTGQSNYAAPVTPTLSLTTTQGLIDFRIETWNGSAWVVVPNGTISGSNRVWTQLTFAPITTTKIRLWITNAASSWSRVTEIEAWTVAGSTVPGAFGKTAPAAAATPSPTGVSLSWAASTDATSYEYCIDTTNNALCDASWVSTTALSATLGTLTPGTSYFWQVRARNATGTTDADGGLWWSFTPTSGTAGVNVAAAARGATVIASSSHPSGLFPTSGAINGDRLGLNWGSGGGWNDGTSDQWPDWMEVTFAGSQTIGEVDVFTGQNNYAAPVTPTLSLTTTQGLIDFRIETWNGSAWVVVPNGTITGSNKVWTQLTFAPITTTKIRLWITNSASSWSRVTEIEAWTVSGGSTPAPGAFVKIAPTAAATPSPTGVSLSWAASSDATSYEYCIDTINNALCDASWVSTTSLSASLGTLAAGTSYFWQVRARNATGTTDANAATWWSFTATSVATRANVAAAANGGSVVASSSHPSGSFPATGAINGDRLGLNWGNGGGWNDGTSNQWPDWMEVTFAGSQTIGEVDVFTGQTNYAAPVTPTLSLTTTQGLIDFQIEAWNGSAWVIVPNGAITGSNKVWTQITFAPVTTTKIRLWITNAASSWSRVTELEAWTVATGTVPTALVKTAPVSGSSTASSSATLAWSGGSGATSFEYCVDTTNNNTCDTSWVSTTALSATVNTLVQNTTYYWQARARNATGVTDADGGTWSSFTTVGLNIAVSNVYVTQATQRPDGTVSLVANRNALLRVFVTANGANSLRPDVRVRIYDGTTLLQTVVIPAPETSVRTATSEGVLTSTWNTIIPAANVRPSLRVLADVDPSLLIPEADRTDNIFPRSGTSALVSVMTVPTFTVRFVPITVADVTGVVSEANKESFLTSTRLYLPINTIVSDVRAPFTSSAPALQSNNANSAWGTVLSELNALRVTDGALSTQHYYGVVKTSYNSGVAGIGYVPGRSALGWDYLPSGNEVAAHEWGHNFSRPHTPCGVSGDANYPYTGGVIGMYGWNATTNALVAPTATDFMGYCGNVWTSDWTWSKVMTYRQASNMQAMAFAEAHAPAEGLLVWGRVVDGRVMLEPSFRVTAMITPQPTMASHHVQLMDATGATLLDAPINAELVDHTDAQEERQFAVVLPWSESLEQSLARVRVSDVRQPLASAERVTVGVSAPSAGSAAVGRMQASLPEPQSQVTIVDGARARVRWDTRAYPLAMVRDAATGEVMGFVRRADQMVTTNGRRIDVVYSDGVRSVVRR